MSTEKPKAIPIDIPMSALISQVVGKEANKIFSESESLEEFLARFGELTREIRDYCHEAVDKIMDANNLSAAVVYGELTERAESDADVSQTSETPTIKAPLYIR
jgi:hypothetical protein